MRKILGVTGIRSEYDIMTPVYRAIEAHSKLQLQLVVTGTHLSPHHNFTLNQIEKDGFPIADRIESLFNSDQKSSRAKGLAVQLAGLVQSVSRIEPDFLLVLGDREVDEGTAAVRSRQGEQFGAMSHMDAAAWLAQRGLPPSLDL